MRDPGSAASVGMITAWGRLAGALAVVAAAVALMGGAPHRTISELRVCADPYNMPFSDDREQGFENKIANVVARDLNARVVNYWWPHRRGLVRNSLSAGYCDVIIGAPVGWDLVATTRPYYRSTYYFVYRADRGLTLNSLDDTLLRHLRIGVNIIGYDYTNTPPVHALGVRGIVGLVGFGNFLNPDPKADHPQDIIDAVAKDSIDVAIVWGPRAGYWAKRATVPLTLVALPDSDAASGMRFAFDFAMGVRRHDNERQAQLDSVIERRRGEIFGILQDYNVPMDRDAPYEHPRRPALHFESSHGGMCMMTKRLVRSGLVSGCLVAAAVIMGAPWGTRAQATVASPAADTAHDSLLVSDSVYRGWKWFHVYCFRCHGEDAIGGVNPAAPDLRWALSASGANFPRDSFVYTALNGRLAKGMPSWKVLLDTSAIQALYVYVKARSDGWLKPGRPHRVPDLQNKTQ